MKTAEEWVNSVYFSHRGAEELVEIVRAIQADAAKVHDRSKDSDIIMARIEKLQHDRDAIEKEINFLRGVWREADRIETRAQTMKDIEQYKED